MNRKPARDLTDAELVFIAAAIKLLNLDAAGVPQHRLIQRIGENYEIHVGE